MSEWERSPSIEAKRRMILLQCRALTVIDGVVDVRQRRLIRACSIAPGGRDATVRMTLPCRRLATASLGRWHESTPPSGHMVPSVITAGLDGDSGVAGWYPSTIAPSPAARKAAATLITFTAPVVSAVDRMSSSAWSGVSSGLYARSAVSTPATSPALVLDPSMVAGSPVSQSALSSPQPRAERSSASPREADVQGPPPASVAPTASAEP